MNVSVRAPGKAMLAGEYAVLEPGEPALVLAVSRFVSVEMRARPRAESLSEHAVLLLSDEHDLRACGAFEPGGTFGLLPAGAGSFFRFAACALSESGRDRVERGLTLPTGVEVAIRSDLHETGRKLGLGSSAAVTVAVIGALLADEQTSQLGERTLPLAIRAHRAAQGGRGSGADVAASALGGLLRYVRPATPDGEPDIERIPVPESLEIRFFAMDRAADTREFVDRVAAFRAKNPASYGRFVASSRKGVEAVQAALESANLPGLLEAVDRLAEGLREMGETAGVSIEPPEITRLRRRVREAGGALKLSGAGGGDLGVILLSPDTDGLRVTTLLLEAGQHSIRAALEPRGVRPE